MSGHEPYVLAGVALISLALYALVVHTNPLRRIIALNVMGSGVFMVLIGSAARGDGPADPVPHALVLTGIVVAVATSGLAIAIARTLHRTRDDDEDAPGGKDGEP
jgi:multicomponent Na+:H+ antiporter subunit C